VFEGVLNGFALGIEDRFFWSDNDFCFHQERAGKCLRGNFARDRGDARANFDSHFPLDGSEVRD
jgi:hypothetical protein